MADMTPQDTLWNGTNGRRLDSWKEIAAYLKRYVTTVRRWEKREDFPVHRHVHDIVDARFEQLERVLEHFLAAHGDDGSR